MTKYRAIIRIDHSRTRRHILDPYQFLSDRSFIDDQKAIKHFSKTLEDHAFEVLRDESPTEYVSAFVLIYRSPKAIEIFKAGKQYKFI